MSQITTFSTGGGGGSGTVTSVSGGNNITITGVPTINPTVNVSGTTQFAVQVGSSVGALFSLPLGTSGQVLTSNGIGLNPTWQTPVANSISITGDSGGTLTGNAFIFTGGTTGLVFGGSSSPNTEVLGGILAIANGGTNANTMANTDGVVYYDGTRLVTTTVGTATQVLTSNGAGMAPTFQAVSASGAIETITGNTGGAESPSAGNFNIVTANSTVLFAGTAATETVDFNRTTNLMLGTSLPALAGGINNTGIGVSAGTALTSGNYNALVGWNAGLKLTTGSGNTVVGQLALANATTSSYNTALGYAALFNIVTTGGSTNAFNIGIGYQAGPNISTGIQNILIGENAGGAITTGSGNTIISNAAPNWNTASVGNVIIGGSTFALSGTGNYILNIGVIDTPTVADNAIRIGTLTGANKHTTCYIGGVDGVNVGSTAQVVTEVSGQLGSATIVGASGITVTPSANTITISNSGGGLSWSVISVNQTAAVNNGYFCNKAGTLALALPAVSAVGDEITITNENTALGAQFTQGLLQQILLPNNTSTTLGATGTLTSSAIGDTITIVCKTANLVWRCTNIVGNWTPA